jgi:hypothetical protein
MLLNSLIMVMSVIVLKDHQFPLSLIVWGSCFLIEKTIEILLKLGLTFH